MGARSCIFAGPRATHRLGYRILAANADEAEILVYSEIGAPFWGDEISAEDFVRELNAIQAAVIHVRINSVGGDVFHGNAIFNALQRHPAKVFTHVDGIAASIASIIALAGERVYIAENAFLMIHNPWTIALGDAAELRKVADEIDTVAGSLIGTYARRTGKSVEQIKDWMDAETWFNADDAIKEGFADEVEQPKKIDAKIAACVRDAKFARTPKQLVAQLEAPAPETPAGPDPLVLMAAAEWEMVRARTAVL